ncbi:unnamed protein product [Auanema sp. JU1783]|nr:unnamed protein product [Auanema sp. JU1783]
MLELKNFYENDKELVNRDDWSDETDRSEDEWLAQSILYLNVASLVANLVASILSGSLSILSLFIDSSMDISCSFVMNICIYLIQKRDTINYPRGRERLETIGAVLCAILMIFANIIMIFQTVSSIISDVKGPTMDFYTMSILIVQTVLKALFCYLCYRRSSTSSLVIAMDLRNDIVTRCLALVFALSGDYVWKYADSVGAVIICSIITVSWIRHISEIVPNLIGKRGNQQNISRILKIVLDHDERIKFIDHIMVYHTWDQALVELHVVMDEHLTLKTTHDICHPLEKKLQRLPFVERAFIHCDYYCDGD